MNISIKTIIVAIILVSLMIINSLLSSPIKELYLNSEEMPFKTLNKWDNALGICGRNLVFPYFKNTNILASQRALSEPTINSIPAGECRYNYIPKNVNNSYSIVYEHGLFYTLKRACIRLNLDALVIGSNNRFNIKFDNSKGQDRTNIAILYLLNPLWIEFVPKSTRTTLAYNIYHNKAITSKSIDDGLISTFQCILPYNSGGTDDLFNYKQLSPSQTEFNHNDTIICQANKHINMNIYYLDEITSSFQTTGRYMKPEVNGSGSLIMFDPNFDALYDQNTHTQTYQFMNNVGLMYKNFTIPIFTFEMDIFILTGQNQAISQCYMQNNIGSYWNCNIANNIGQPINNIYMMTMEDAPDNTVNIKVFTGGNNGLCQDNQNNVMINIPVVSANTPVKVIFTISPYNNILYAEWKDIEKGDKIKHYSYIQNQTCKNGINNNALYKLFCDKSANVREPLKQIMLTYKPNIVKNINEITLGYKNYYNKFSL
jgi:hypothetical protein